MISALGALTYNLLPMFLGAAQDFRGLDDQSVGILWSSFFVGFTLATISAYFWIRRFNWRVVSFTAILVAASGLVATGLAESYALMTTAIAVTGAAFSVLYGIGATLLGDTKRPARWYGLKIASEAALGAILLLILPTMVIQRWGFGGLMAAVAAVLIVLSPLLAGLPARGVKGGLRVAEKHTPPLAPALKLALWLGLAGVLTYLFCTTLIWAFTERIAQDAGLDVVTSDYVLAASLALAVCGSLAAMVLSDRYGLAIPLAVTTLLMMVSLALLGGMNSLPSYAVATCLFTFSFGLGTPYTLSVIAGLDIDGRYVVLTVPAIGIGVMLAPVIGGMLTGVGGHSAILITAAASALVALSFALFALRLGLPHVRAYRM